MSFVNLFKPECIILDLEAFDADSVLSSLTGTHVANNPSLASRSDEILEALKLRESQGSTGASGVGIPHIKLDNIEKVSIVIAIHKEGVDFNALDGENVNVFFSILRPIDSADEHLDLLRWVASLAQHEDFVSFACQASDASQVIDMLSELVEA
ncbi:MAG: mannitol/fructose-specific phosphotransferase system IIA component (Ntr-type) [Myxococcota bacterium]|jgi:mannitol/fructose-specific phosphotransferase system IIA component (Ntr-type)